MFVKVCGFTSRPQAAFAAKLGVSAVGLVMAASPRQVSPDEARAVTVHLPWNVWRVGVFVNASFRDIVASCRIARLDTVQLHGAEPPDLVQQLVQAGWRVIKALRVQDEGVLAQVSHYRETGVTAILLDSYVPGQAGGSGTSFNWSIAEKAKGFGVPIILAGGLGPENVETAIRSVQPYGIDVSSSIERSPGDKDLEKLALLMEKVRSVVTSAS